MVCPWFFLFLGGDEGGGERFLVSCFVGVVVSIPYGSVEEEEEVEEGTK